VLNALAATQAFEYTGQLLTVVQRDDDRDRLPDRLLGRVSVEARCGRIPRRDHPIQGLADDRVVSRFHHGLEVRDRLLGSLTLRDVARDTASAHELLALKQRVRADQHLAD
jgi:hypothetical protein